MRALIYTQFVSNIYWYCSLCFVMEVGILDFLFVISITTVLVTWDLS